MKWAEVALGDVARIMRHSVSPADRDPSERYLGLEHIERGGRILGSQSVGDAELKSTKFEFKHNQVLYGKLRPNLGKIARPTFDGICSTDILPVAPGPRLDRDFLAHYLSQDGMVVYAAARAAGANLPRLSPQELAKFPLPLPPLDEQRRIAAILDHADDLKAKQLKVLTHLEEAKSTYFFALARKADWSSAPIGSLGVIKTGKTPPTALEGMFGGDVPFLTPGDLGSDRRPARTVTDEGAMQSQVVRAGATLVCCIGATIGKVGVARQRATFNQQINAVEWGPQILDEYGHQALRGMRAQIVSRGASTTMPILSKSKFSSLEVPVPPLAVQQSFSLVSRF